MEKKEEQVTTTFLDFVVIISSNLRYLILLPLFVAILAYGLTYLLTPIFKSTTSFIPPATDASIGNVLAQTGLGTFLGVSQQSSKGNQFKAFFESETLLNKMVERFSLREYYGEDLTVDARKVLMQATDIYVSKKDNIIFLSVSDKDRSLASEIVNAYVEELTKMLRNFAITSSQRKSRFFESQILEAEQEISFAKTNLKASGFKQDGLNLRPERYLALVFKYEDRLISLGLELMDKLVYLNEDAREVKTLRNKIESLEDKLRYLEVQMKDTYGETWETEILKEVETIKQKEKLLSFFRKQFEAAQVEMAEQGTAIQIIDVGSIPEVKSKPNRILTTLMAGIGTGIFALIYVFVSAATQNIRDNDPLGREKLKRIGL